MPLLQANLKAALLQQLAPPPDGIGFPINEAAAIEGWAEAFAVYFESAIATPPGVPVVVSALRTTTPPATNNPKDAAKAAMAGIQTAGAASISAGIAAFWGTMAPPTSAPAFFAACLGITPPAGLAGLTAALIAAFTANTVGKLSAPDSYNAISIAVHTANIGGVATFPAGIFGTIA